MALKMIFWNLFAKNQADLVEFDTTNKEPYILVGF